MTGDRGSDGPPTWGALFKRAAGAGATVGAVRRALADRRGEDDGG